MRLSFLYSTGLHILFFALLFVFMQPAAQKTKAVYTIDFIGAAANTPARFGNPEPAGKPAAKEPAKKPAESEIKVKEPVKKEPAKPAYNAQEQITQKPNPKPAAPKPEPKKEEKVVLGKPSILGEVSSENIDPSKEHELVGAGPGSNAVRASFTNFPHPYYITLVRNALWKEWSKRMPNKTGLSTLVSFNIDRNGAIYGVQIEQSSGNESYDYAAVSSVNNSAPYPPLPKEFTKDILTVTVEFKNET